MSKLIKKKSAELELTKKMADSFAMEYLSVSAQIKTMEERKKHLADLLKVYASEHGIEDDKGSKYCEGENVVYGVVAKTKVVPVVNIIERLEEMGRDDCIAVIKTANTSLIDHYHSEGIMSDDDIKKLYKTESMKPSVYVKAKEEMPEVQKTAASRKR